MADDDTRYSITRKPQPRVTRAQVEAAREAALASRAAQVRPLPLQAPPEPEPPPLELAQGSQVALRSPEVPASRGVAMKVEFGPVALTVEHLGDEVSIVIPGALRLTAPRAHAMALIAALMKRP